MNTITTTQLLTILREGAPYYVWDGECGYDTRPTIMFWPTSEHAPYRERTLPFAHDVAFATNYMEPHHVAEDAVVLTLLGTACEGDSVSIPDYEGSRKDGETIYVRTADAQWEVCGYIPYV